MAEKSCSISDRDVIGEAMNETFDQKVSYGDLKMVTIVVHILVYVIEKALAKKKVKWIEVTLKIQNILSLELQNPSFLLTFFSF